MGFILRKWLKDGVNMDNKIPVHVMGVDYSTNVKDSKMHVTLDIDIKKNHDWII